MSIELTLNAPRVSLEFSISFSSLYLTAGRFSFGAVFEMPPKGAPFVALTRGRRARDWRLDVGPLQLFAAIEPRILGLSSADAA